MKRTNLLALSTIAVLAAACAGMQQADDSQYAEKALATMKASFKERGQAKLEAWCAAPGVQEAIGGGFFVRPHGLALGEVRTRGVVREHVPFTAPFDGRDAKGKGLVGHAMLQSRSSKLAALVGWSTGSAAPLSE